MELEQIPKISLEQFDEFDKIEDFSDRLKWWIENISKYNFFANYLEKEIISCLPSSSHDFESRLFIEQFSFVFTENKYNTVDSCLSYLKEKNEKLPERNKELFMEDFFRPFYNMNEFHSSGNYYDLGKSMTVQNDFTKFSSLYNSTCENCIIYFEIDGDADFWGRLADNIFTQIRGYVYQITAFAMKDYLNEIESDEHANENNENIEELNSNQWTNQQTAILFEYILRAMGTEMNAVKVSEFIHGFTGRSAQSIRTRIGAKKEKTYTDDLVFVRNECEKIGLLEVVKLLNKDIEISK